MAGAAEKSRLKSYRFRKERERTWRELDGFVTRVEKKGGPHGVFRTFGLAS